MLIKTVLLIIASQGYQPIEYGYTRKMIEFAGFKVEVASNLKQDAFASPHAKSCGCNQAPNPFQKVHVDVALSEVDANKYDGIFIIGGPGALEFLDNETTYALMRTMAKDDKAFGAICISPRILAAARVLDGKKATGWDEDNELSTIFKSHNITYIKEPVVVDGKIVTADGPAAAVNFGKAIVNVLKNT